LCAKVMFARAPSPTGETYSSEGRCQQPLKSSYDVLLPPLSSMYTAALLEADGHDVRIIDSQSAWMPPEEFVKRVLDFGPDFIFLQSSLQLMPSEVAILGRIKEHLASVTAGMFDVGPTFFHRSLAAEKPVDLVARHEPEQTIQEVVSRRSAQGVPGTTHHSSEGIVVEPDRPALEDLDSLPLPARHLISIPSYTQPFTGEPYQPIQTSRGCPHRCIFCVVPPYSGRRPRHRSPGSILREMRHLIDKYGLKWFYLFADTFTLDRKRVIELSRSIVDSGIKVNLFGNARVDTIDDEVAASLSEAGCRILSFGVESGSDETLKRIRKGITTQQTREAIRICRDHGIATNAFVVLGFPWERRGDVERTIGFVFDLDPDFVQFLVPIPIPGTPMHSLYTEKYPHLVDWESASAFENFTSSAVRTEDMTAEDLDLLRKRALTRFYLRPRKIISTARREGLHTLFRAAPIFINRVLR